LPADVLAHDAHLNVGEAALYGINFDDTEYDYMQHLRPVGLEEEGVESILIDAPATQKSKGKGKAKAIELRDDLPADALPSKHEIPRNFEAEEAVPSSISGFQPDMNPHLRQALDALEDDAFVDDGLEEDFFSELVTGGERGEADALEYEFHEWGETDGRSHNSTASIEDAKGEDEDESWEARFAKFKLEQKAAPSQSESDDDFSEDRDTISALPKLPVIGGKRRRKGTSDASGYSMSSSSMYRTDTLQTLDERFDRIMEKEYNSDGEEDTEDLETPSDVSDEAPELITSREDFEALLSELDNYEILGRKLKPVLEGETGAQKLEVLRRAMGQDERVRLMMDGEDEGPDDAEIFAPFGGEDKKDRWDCETILTTYSNLENHPRIISVRSNKKIPKIKLDPRTGLPSIEEGKPAKSLPVQSDEGEDEDESRVPRETVTRSRNESKEEKKARKQAVKAERSVRRVEKKGKKEQFNSEMKQQAQGMANANMRTRKL